METERGWSIEGSIYGGMAASLYRDGKPVAQVYKYEDALEILEALNASPDRRVRDALVGIANAVRLGADTDLAAWRSLANACQQTARDALAATPNPVESPSGVREALDFANEENRAVVLDAVAEAIHDSIFDEPLGQVGTIERALYRQAANDALAAGVRAYEALASTPSRGDTENAR